MAHIVYVVLEIQSSFIGMSLSLYDYKDDDLASMKKIPPKNNQNLSRSVWKTTASSDAI